MPAKRRAQLNPTPSAQSENEPSIVEKEIVAKVETGTDTDELSDLSEGCEGSSRSTKGSSTFSFWYRRIAPLVRNKQVRVLSIINCILTMVNMFLVLLMIACCLWLLGLKIKANMIYQSEMPCLYSFKPWSECPVTCWEEGDPIPVMTREIDETKLVMTRGKEYAPCPENIRKGFVQKAPCNVQKCPQLLSSFTNWTECFHKEPSKRKAGGCYKMRILPLTDTLITVDTIDLTVDCPPDECPDVIL